MFCYKRHDSAFFAAQKKTKVYYNKTLKNIVATRFRVIVIIEGKKNHDNKKKDMFIL